MLASALGAVGNRFDAAFVTAFWTPAFLAVFGAIGVWTLGAGWGVVAARLENLETMTQGFLLLLLLLAVTILAFVLQALARPIAAIFAGDLLPRQVAGWMQRAQLQKHNANSGERAPGAPVTGESDDQRIATLTARQAPRRHADFRATRIGNMMAIANEHPRMAYSMAGLFWWPRLTPVAPADFQAKLASAQSPLMALLNLSIVFIGLAATAVLAMITADLAPLWALALALGFLLLSNVCYRAAVSQAEQLSALLCVGFDLYRHDILRMMDIEVPGSLEEERKLWASLTREVLALREQDHEDASAPDASASGATAASGGDAAPVSDALPGNDAAPAADAS